MTKSELQSAVSALKWYHRIELPHGITTPGLFPINPEFYKLPADLTGKHVLDVGTYDGYWCFEALRRGADEVMAIDDFSDAIYPGEKRSWSQFGLCARALGFENKCSVREMSVYDLAKWKSMQFDVVMFFGVAYHLRHVLLGLDALRHVCAPGALLCVESHISDDFSPYGDGHGEKMVMEFYPGNQLAGCSTNFWGPTLKCLANMVESAGFKDVKAWKIADPGEMTYARGFVQAIAA